MNKVSEVEKVIQFNKDGKILQTMADEKIAFGDLKGGLAILLDVEEQFRFGPLLYSKIANLYTQLEMYNESIVYWFKYLNSVSKRHYVEAYNGLGGNYYLLGYKEISAYYFNLQINDKEDRELPFDEYMFKMFYESREDKPLIHLVDVQGDKDEETIENAKEIFDKEPTKAYRIVEEISENSSNYGEAQITLASFDMIKGDYKKAILRFIKLINNGYESDYCYNNIFGCYITTKQLEEAEHAFNIINKRKIADYDQLAKFFQILKVDGSDESAYIFSKYMLRLFDKPNVKFLAGCASFNFAKFKEARPLFFEYYSITKSCFSLYYIRLCDKLCNNKTTSDIKFDKADYTFSLPFSIIQSLDKEAYSYLNFTSSQAKRNSEKIFEFCDKCFAVQSLQLQGIACQILSLLNNNKSEKYLKNLLINPMVNDKIKLIIVTLLVEMGNDKLTGFVYGNVYSRIQFEKVEFSEQNGDIFIDAYALCFGRLAPFDENQLYKLKISAYDIYYKLIANGNVRKVNDVLALATLIVFNSGIETNLSKDGLMKYIGSDKANVIKLQNLLKEE